MIHLLALLASFACAAPDPTPTPPFSNGSWPYQQEWAVNNVLRILEVLAPGPPIPTSTPSTWTVNVGSTPVKLTTPEPNSALLGISCPVGVTDLFYGNSGVTTSNGFPLLASDTVLLQRGATSEWWGVTTGVTITVRLKRVPRN